MDRSIMDGGITRKLSPRAPVVVLVASTAMLLSATRPRAQEAADAPGTALGRYLALASAYRDGDHSGSSRALSAWSQEQVMEVLAPVLTLQEAEVGTAGLDDPTLVAAALLHTELGLARLARLGPIRARFHIETAQDLIGLLVEAPFPGFQDHWRLAVGCGYRVSFYLSETEQLLEESGPLGAPDPRSLVLLGSVHELRSTYRNPTCSSRNECPNRATRASYDRLEAERKQEMHRASSYYAQALENEPEVSEARLRLGRTLARSGRVEAARTHLRRVLQEPVSARTAYLAHLFLGQTFERAGDLETSLAEYRSAVAALPRGQAGHLALAHALRQSGDRAGEQEALSYPVGGESRPPDPFDPWWVYAARPEVCSGDLWDDLRRDALS